jgi:HK97 gp10 family phage protein
MMDVKIEGLKELDAAIRQMTDNVQGRLLRQAANAGAQVIRKEARAKAPKDTGLLRKNIVVGRSRRQSAKGKETYNVFLKKEKRTFADTKANRRKNRVGKKYEVDGPAFYGKFIEMGTSKMPARPFLRPALEGKRGEAIAAFREKMAEGIRKLSK